jgi:hypothetical protein
MNAGVNAWFHARKCCKTYKREIPRFGERGREPIDYKSKTESNAIRALRPPVANFRLFDKQGAVLNEQFASLCTICFPFHAAHFATVSTIVRFSAIYFLPF